MLRNQRPSAVTASASWAAYACAGSLDAAELARIAAARAALMDQGGGRKTHGGMLAVQGMRRDEVDRLCAGQRAWIAIAIGPQEFVIGGEDLRWQKLGKEFSERGAKVTPLKVGVASHTPLLERCRSAVPRIA